MGRKSKRGAPPPGQSVPASVTAIPWEEVRTPGRASALAAGAAGTVYVETESGVHASADEGRTWAPIAAPEARVLVSPAGVARAPGLGAGERVTAAAVEPSGALWVAVEAAGLHFYPTPSADGTPILHGASVFTRRIVRSQDGGASWRVVSDLAASGLAIDERGRAWVAGGAGLHASDDGGATWRRVLEGGATCVAVSGARVVVGAAQARVSDDEGRTFRPVAGRFVERGPWGSLEGEAADLRALARAPDGAIWAAARGAGGAVFRLAAGGERWESVNLGLTVVPRQGMRQGGVRASALALTPSGTALVATEGHGVFRRRIEAR